MTLIITDQYNFKLKTLITDCLLALLVFYKMSYFAESNNVVISSYLYEP